MMSQLPVSEKECPLLQVMDYCSIPCKFCVSLLQLHHRRMAPLQVPLLPMVSGNHFISHLSIHSVRLRDSESGAKFVCHTDAFHGWPICRNAMGYKRERRWSLAFMS